MHKEPTIILFGNRQAKRCHATNRKGMQCRNAVCRGKLTCKNHGGKSTGPKTEEGRKRCAEAKTVHGKDTRKIRQRRSALSRELYELEVEGRRLGLITGAKSPGRKPKID
jgi:hypothetical protein